MEFFTWDNSLSVKIDKIDSHHKNLFKIINQYFNAIKEAKAKKVLIDTIDELIRYGQYHFQTEEKYFDDFNYEFTKEHKAKHKHYIEKIGDYRKMIEEGLGTVDGRSITVDLWKFMKDWLVNHVSIDDKKYSEDFIKNGHLKDMQEGLSQK